MSVNRLNHSHTETHMGGVCGLTSPLEWAFLYTLGRGRH